jgi:hypothetical protein
MKLVRWIKMCLNETYSNIRIGKYLFESFPIQNPIQNWFFDFALEYRGM